MYIGNCIVCGKEIRSANRRFHCSDCYSNFDFYGNDIASIRLYINEIIAEANDLLKKIEVVASGYQVTYNLQLEQSCSNKNWYRLDMPCLEKVPRSPGAVDEKAKL
ncbi:MAG TPA: hypothetical protein DDX98_08105 [Bacteroidales bacterium]|jgi:hypothetical protein|nr:hypothetical protein [Bacteroidales bacterium]